MLKIPITIKKPEMDFKKLFKNDVSIKILIFSSLFLALFLIFLLNASPQKFNLKVGDVANEDIYAPSDIVDKAATELKVKEAEENIQTAYKLDLTIQIDIEKTIDNLFHQITSVKSNESLDAQQKLMVLQEDGNLGLSSEYYSMLMNTPDADLKQLRDNIKYIINQILSERIVEGQLPDKKDTIREFFASIPKNSKLNEIGTDIAVKVLQPNMFYDEQATMMKKKEARENIEQVIIKKDTKIVTKGQETTMEQIELLKAYGLLNTKDSSGLRFIINSGFFIIIAIGMFMLGMYCVRFDPKLWANNGNLLLISIIMLISLIIAIGMKAISEYLILLPACTMIIAMLINPRIAILSNIVMAVFVSIITKFNITVMTVMLLAGLLGAMMVYKTHHRSTIMFAGLSISILSIMIIFSFGFILRMDIKKILFDALFGFVGGILSSILTIGTLPFLETTFDIITPIKLLELSNPNQPLLRRLLMEAPGTYYHSIVVGNLAEAAAQEVGANSLLCRIGAYYHDMGKLKRPYFFKENQITKDNPHDKITPNLSALIITSHVRDGIELAKKNKLPSSVIDIIREHHGNTLVSYFYHKAMNSEGAETVTEDKFRYPYSRPSSKEAAIVMLADSVEAYIRSLSEPTQNQVEQGVRKIIGDKLQDAQLDLCDLTLRDLDTIAKAFVKVLAGIFHERIEYPENIRDI